MALAAAMPLILRGEYALAFGDRDREDGMRALDRGAHVDGRAESLRRHAPHGMIPWAPYGAAVMALPVAALVDKIRPAAAESACSPTAIRCISQRATLARLLR